MKELNQGQDEQAARWNGTAGRAWTDVQAALDLMLEPFERHLVDAAASAGARSVLDVGCGTGATTLAIARRLGAGVQCVGLDISEPMLERAKNRAEEQASPARFICADAQSHPLEPGAFELVVSRFGVMFFRDSVAAFANLRAATAPGGQLRFVAWRAAAENPFMTTAERAAAKFLPNLPPRKPDAPGQFAFADSERIRRILRESGWIDVDIQPLDLECRLPAAHLAQYYTRLGPLGEVLQGADDSTRAQVSAAVNAAFQPYVNGSEVRFMAACWTVGARRSALT
jgi:ubiquinone/menaquinone biosynthesis C-methylase UbiE